MARAISGAVVLGAAVAACFSTPTRPGDGTDDSGVNRDSSLIDGLPLDSMLNIDGNPDNCTTDSFVGSGSGSCGPVLTNYQASSGIVYLSGTSDGEMKLNMFGGSNSFVNCTSPPAGWSRVTIDVQGVATSATTNHTFVGLQSMDGQGHWGLDFSRAGDGSPAFLPLCEGSTVPVSPAVWNSLEHRYVKIERTLSNQMTVSTSDDNMGFNMVSQCTSVADLSTLQAQLRVYTAAAGSNGTSTSDIATFGFVELCQD